MTTRNDISQLLSLEGKHAVVTGSATGIGEGIAEIFAAAGAQVTVADRDGVGAQRVASAIGGRAVQVDLTNEKEVLDLINGMEQVDIVVNNAGSYFDVGPILDQSIDSWRRAMDNNLTTCYLVSRAAARRMIDAGNGGSIVNISLKKILLNFNICYCVINRPC